MTREDYGRLVRETWVAWALEQPADQRKHHWLIGWDDLDPGQREVDMRIGEAVAAAERKRLTEPPGKRLCPRDHYKWGRNMPMDRILLYGSGWACPGILLNGEDCGFVLGPDGEARGSAA